MQAEPSLSGATARRRFPTVRVLRRLGTLIGFVVGLGTAGGFAVGAASPGEAHGATRAGTAAPKDRAEASFIGFRQLTTTRALVYVELNRPVDAQQTGTGRTLEFLLPDTRVPLRNNRRPLLAGHFDSPVQSAQLVTSGRAVKLVIQLREDAVPSTRLVKTSLGATLEVEIARAPGPAPQP